MAAKSAAFSRVRVTYDNGLIVVANASREPLRWHNMVLPQYGWAAKARGLLAYTAMCGATVCDYAETSTSVFANARSQADAGIGRAYATPRQRSPAEFARDGGEFRRGADGRNDLHSPGPWAMGSASVSTLAGFYRVAARFEICDAGQCNGRRWQQLSA